MQNPLLSQQKNPVLNVYQDDAVFDSLRSELAPFVHSIYGTSYLGDFYTPTNYISVYEDCLGGHFKQFSEANGGLVKFWLKQLPESLVASNKHILKAHLNKSFATRFNSVITSLIEFLIQTDSAEYLNFISEIDEAIIVSIKGIQITTATAKKEFIKILKVIRDIKEFSFDETVKTIDDFISFLFHFMDYVDHPFTGNINDDIFQFFIEDIFLIPDFITPVYIAEMGSFELSIKSSPHRTESPKAFTALIITENTDTTQNIINRLETVVKGDLSILSNWS